MKKLNFEIKINASPDKVWDVITGENTYNQWTAPFAEGSTVETDWKKGSKALFLDGKGNGMVSEIAESIPGEFLSIRHLGEMQNGEEDPMTYQDSGWVDAWENYTLENIGGSTLWQVSLDMQEEYVEYMEEHWPLALNKVKELAESLRIEKHF